MHNYQPGARAPATDASTTVHAALPSWWTESRDDTSVLSYLRHPGPIPGLHSVVPVALRWPSNQSRWMDQREWPRQGATHRETAAA